MSSSPVGSVSVPFGLDAVFHESFFYQSVKFYDTPKHLTSQSLIQNYLSIINPLRDGV
jgi:hypothetical protein